MVVLLASLEPLGRQALLASLDDADVVSVLAAVLAADRYVQVMATPQ